MRGAERRKASRRTAPALIVEVKPYPQEEGVQHPLEIEEDFFCETFL